MNDEFVKLIASAFFNWPVDQINILGWKYVFGTLTFKIEDANGMVCIYSIGPCGFEGYAKSLDKNDFGCMV